MPKRLSSYFNHTRFFRRVSSPSLMFFPYAERGKKPRRYQLPRLLAGQTPRKDMLSYQAEIKTRNKEERESRPDGKRHTVGWQTPHNRMANATSRGGICRSVGGKRDTA